MLEPEKLEKKAKVLEEENWMFRAFLKEHESRELDQLVNKLHAELFAQIDCVKCSNCCKKMNPILDAKDIRRIAKHLNLTFDNFVEKYLEKDEEGWSMRVKPCPFLRIKYSSGQVHNLKNIKYEWKASLELSLVHGEKAAGLLVAMNDLINISGQDQLNDSLLTYFQKKYCKHSAFRKEINNILDSIS